MEADCTDYIDPLTFDLDRKMALAVSNWDNSDGRSDFNFEDAPNSGDACTGSWLFSTLDVLTYGSNEEKEEEETDPVPEPEQFQEFLGMIDWNDTNIQMEATEFWVKGLDGGYLEA
jgi:hypothetical protein